MNLDYIEDCFCPFLDKFWSLNNITAFSLAYIRLILLFKNELLESEICTVLERQKQLRGQEFNNSGFDEIQTSNRKYLDSVSTTKSTMLRRLVFCAFLDTEESDFFYLTEPMFEFVRVMKVSAEQLKQVLESEFIGFKL